jgi:uncharacterized hydrophobic protein (TIGR00271 family)
VTVLLAITNEAQAPIVRWAARFAQARGRNLEVLFVSRAVKAQEASDILDDASADDNPVVRALRPMLQEVLDGELAGAFRPYGKKPYDERPSLRLRRVLHPNAASAVLDEAAEVDAELLVVGKYQPASERWAGRLARRLLRAAPCDVIVVRAGAESGKACERILATTAGGSHAAQGLRELVKWLERADIQPSERIVPEAVVAPSVEEGVASLADGADLLLVGASDRNIVQQVLFGDLAERLLEGERPGAIALIRRQKPLHHRTLDLLRRLSVRWVPQLDREERLSLFEHLHQGSHWNRDFLALISLSTAIASLGLLQNSAAVVIGAMLVAPLMTPMIGAGLALVQGNSLLMRNSAQAIAFGFLTALGIGAAFGLLVPGSGLSAELLARGSPTLLDMVIALLSGVAAAYALARPGLTGALPGVAIAAALVPPISTAGVSLSRGELMVGQGAALLFATNLVAIILGAALVFRAMGVHGKKEAADAALWARRAVLGLVLMSVILMVPLGFFLYNQVVQQERDRIHISEGLMTRVSDRVQQLEGLRLISLQRHAHGDQDELEVVVASGADADEELSGRVAKVVSEELPRPIAIRVTCLKASWSVAAEPNKPD